MKLSGYSTVGQQQQKSGAYLVLTLTPASGATIGAPRPFEGSTRGSCRLGFYSGNHYTCWSCRDYRRAVRPVIRNESEACRNKEGKMGTYKETIRIEEETPSCTIRLIKSGNFSRAYNHSAWLFRLHYVLAAINPWLGVLSRYDSFCLRRVLFGHFSGLNAYGRFRAGLLTLTSFLPFL